MSEPDYTLGLWGELKQSAAYTWRILRPVVKVCFVLGIFFILAISALGPVNRQHHTWANTQMQGAHALGLAMYSYATDHDGKYPDGNSSTEVFQKLLDGGYVYAPTFIYTPFSGKIEPFAGQKLKSENVCWDVTCCADSGAPDSLPLVYLTGYKVTYAPGGTAVPIIRPHPPFARTWGQWWEGGAADPAENPGIAIYYKSNRSVFLLPKTPESPDGTIPNFVPPDFDPKGKTYRQLTPDGSLP